MDFRIDLKQMFFRKLIDPFNRHRLVHRGFNHRPRILSLKAPQCCRRQLGMQALLELHHAYLVFQLSFVLAHRLQAARDGQRINKLQQPVNTFIARFGRARFLGSEQPACLASARNHQA